MASEQLKNLHSSISPSKLIRKVQVFKGSIPIEKVAGLRQVLGQNSIRWSPGHWTRCSACVALSFFLVLLEIDCRQTPIRSGIELDRGSAEILGSPDIAFAVQCMQDGAGAIGEGKLAGRLATDSDVKSLASELVMEYSRANAQLEAIAANKKIRFSDLETAKAQDTEQKLAKNSGFRFDNQYVIHTWKREKSQLKRYRKEVKSGKDPQIHAFAVQRLPEIRSAVEKLKALRMKLRSR